MAERIVQSHTAAAIAIGSRVGKLMAFDEQGVPQVDFKGSPRDWPLSARTTVELAREDVGCEVVLLFDGGELDRPIIVGRVRTASQLAERRPATVEVDGERILLEGQEEVVLRCGKASITLTRAGKILLQGTYLLNRSDGVNRILGGSVEIN